MINNISNVAAFTNVAPDASGHVLIQSRADTTDNSIATYFNGIIIEELLDAG